MVHLLACAGYSCSSLGDSKVAEPNTTLLSTPAPDIDSVAQLDEEELNDMMEASKDFFGEWTLGNSSWIKNALWGTLFQRAFPHSDFIGKGLVCGLSQSNNVWATTVICVDCLVGLHSRNLFGRWFCWWGIGGCLYTLTCHLHWPLKLATFQKFEAKIDTPWLAGLAFMAPKLFGTWVMLLHGDVQTNEICSNAGAGGRCHALWIYRDKKWAHFWSCGPASQPWAPLVYVYMALDGDENHADQARYKAMCLTAFRSDAFGRVPKRWPFLWGWSYFPAMSQWLSQ